MIPRYQKFKDYYDNGMVKLNNRIEDEFWYNDYQTVMHLIAFNNNDVGKLSVY